jgi:hypothetical protein
VKVVRQELAVAQVLLDFKNSLGHDFKTVPYDQEVKTRSRAVMKGKLYDVQNEELHFRLIIDGFSADSKCTWAELPEDTVFTIGEFYLTRAMKDRNGPEIARRGIALAVFARENRMKEEVIKNYLAPVKQSGVDVKDKLESLGLSPLAQ